MTKKEIDKMCDQYQRGELSEKGKEVLAQAIVDNKTTNRILVSELIGAGELSKAAIVLTKIKLK